LKGYQKSITLIKTGRLKQQHVPIFATFSEIWDLEKFHTAEVTFESFKVICDGIVR